MILNISKRELKKLKKRYFSCIAGILLLAMIVLASGCGVKINGKNYELFNSGNNKSNILFDGFGPESSASQDVTGKPDDATGFKVINNAGNIKINKSDSTEIELKSYKKVRGASDEVKKQILENMNVLLEKESDQIQLVVKTKDNQDFWKWQSSNHREYQVTLNIDISLPDAIKAVTVTTGAGNIDMDGITAALSANSGAGNIDIKNSSALGKNKLSSGAGNISFAGNVDGIDSFQITTGVGNVKFVVPDNTKMNLKADTGVGILSGSFIENNDKNKFHFQGDINGGGPEVKLNSGVGNVKADQN